MTNQKKSLIIMVSHHRWAIPIIAEIGRTDGSKFVTLIHRLGISRDSLQRTLLGLIEAGWLMKNPGYGHPLRPEYILTDSGNRLKPICQELFKLISQASLDQVAFQKWSLPILGTIFQGAERFSEIKNKLPSATSRAVTLALKELCQAGLVTRAVIDDFPPTSVYKLQEAGYGLGKLADKIAHK